jgi:hypothetical protein
MSFASKRKAMNLMFRTPMGGESGFIKDVYMGNMTREVRK